MSRIASIDLLRGLVILIMMVDHVRERFFYACLNRGSDRRVSLT